jgi:hypothetical protein
LENFLLCKKARNCDYEMNHDEVVLSADEQLAVSMDYLHRLHRIPTDAEAIREFVKEYKIGEFFAIMTRMHLII